MSIAGGGTGPADLVTTRQMFALWCLKSQQCKLRDPKFHFFILRYVKFHFIVLCYVMAKLPQN